MNSSLYSLALCAALISVIAASSVTSSSYTTSDDASSRRTLFISTFEFTGEQPRGTLYAVVGDKSLIAAKNPETKSFQVSWSEEHKLAGAGTYTVQLYSEEGHAALRKAKRDGQSAEDVKPLATLSIDHNGVTRGRG
ncbi:SSR4 [Bugula neritina]|uniref:Translocon-associated protein subunit delta n=1 Tax=Bugula neritina TaxID=10212 RepID=A0A7J7KIQ8_BUGNE|nr:SSR4 [Bugula neritina]